jgi:hypothetical protein
VAAEDAEPDRCAEAGHDENEPESSALPPATPASTGFAATALTRGRMLPRGCRGYVIGARTNARQCEIQAIQRALDEHGATERTELARLVGARYWGPGIFRAALREALAGGRSSSRRRTGGSSRTSANPGVTHHPAISTPRRASRIACSGAGR